MLKHTDDDGDLSIFIKGQEVLFACSLGHAWIAEANQLAINSPSAEPASVRDDLLMDQLKEAFGPHVSAAMGE